MPLNVKRNKILKEVHNDPFKSLASRKCDRVETVGKPAISHKRVNMERYLGVVKQTRESTEGYSSREKTRQVRENWSQQLGHKQIPKGTKPGVRKGKRPLLACHTRCKCSMETTRNSVKVKLGI